MVESLKNMWKDYEKNHPKAAKWVREGGLFFIFSKFGCHAGRIFPGTGYQFSITEKYHFS